MSSTKEIYLDNNATTPVAQEVREAMLPYLGERFGNPSSLHAKGEEAAQAVRKSRASIARHLGASSDEVIFTSGATESINLAIKGAALSARRERGLKTGHIVTSLVEHEAVLETCAVLGDEGFAVTYLEPDEYGRISPDKVKDALRDDTLLVAIMHANNELGTVYPINEIGQAVKEYNPEIVMFSDGVQSFGKMPIILENIDLYAISAHKLHGPKGIGALYVRHGAKIQPIIYGGGQEDGLRSGTENVAGIVGFTKAAELAHENLSKHEAHLRALRGIFIRGIAEIKNTRINSPDDALPTTVNVAFLGKRGDEVARELGEREIFVSTGSACVSKEQKISHILAALPIAEEVKHGSVRFGLSRYNTEDEIADVVAVLQKTIPAIRT